MISPDRSLAIASEGQDAERRDDQQGPCPGRSWTVCCRLYTGRSGGGFACRAAMSVEVPAVVEALLYRLATNRSMMTWRVKFGLVLGSGPLPAENW